MIGKTADGFRKDAAGCRENMGKEMPLRVRGMAERGSDDGRKVFPRMTGRKDRLYISE